VAKKIFSDIEATADYFGPSLYAGLGDDIRGLLTYYHDVQFNQDPLSAQFVPVTQATRTQDARSHKLFAVGVLPPTANVTGRVLDRSHSIAGDVYGGASSGGVEIEALKIAAGGLVGIAKSYVGTGQRDRRKWLGLLAGPGDKPPQIQLFMAPASSSCALVARGLLRKAGLKHERLQNAYKTAKAMEDIAVIARDFDAYIPGNSSTAPKPGWIIQVGPKGGSGHVFTITEVKRIGSQLVIKSVDGGQKDGGGKQTIKTFERRWHKGGEDVDSKNKKGKWWWDNNGISVRRVQFMMDTALLPFGEEDPTDEDGTGDWNGEGASAAKKAKKEQQKISGTPLNQKSLGKLLEAAQRLQIAETQAALEAMKRAPPLRLLVNPLSFAVKGSKIVQDGSWGRSGPIIEHWGEEQETVSASGKVAGFFAIDVTGAQGPGLTRNARQFSSGWRNLMSLYMFYKNNGGVYLNDHLTVGGEKRNLSLVGSIYIYYDNILYIGSFTTFTLNETADAPFTAEYSFEFNVRAAFLLDRPDAKYDVSFSTANDASNQTFQPTVPTSTGEPTVVDDFNTSAEAALDGGEPYTPPEPVVAPPPPPEKTYEELQAEFDEEHGI